MEGQAKGSHVQKDMSEREATFWRAWIHIARWREKDTHALRDLSISLRLRADKLRREQLCRRTIEGWGIQAKIFPPPLVDSSSDEDCDDANEDSSSDEDSDNAN